MKILIQRVKRAAVSVRQEEVASIGRGLLLFVGVQKGDDNLKAEQLCRKVLTLRVFEDTQGKTNLSIQDIRGQILVVSQFTLAADLKKGNRPSFDTAENPTEARSLIAECVRILKSSGLEISEGLFGAQMEVQLVNDGPATYFLETN